MKTGIEIAVVYTDVHLMELQISASNVAFAGQVNTYVDHSGAAKFSEGLKGFPSKIGDVRRLELGANARFVFSTADDVGHSIVTVEIAADAMRPNNFDGKAAFNILVNPAEIDKFVGELAALAPDIGQSACLKGS
jgi:hypothetical protein